MDTTAVVFRKPDTRIIRPVFKNQPLAVRGYFCFIRYELIIRHPEKRSDAGYFILRNSNNPVRYAAACSASETFKRFHGFFLSFLRIHLTTIVNGRDWTVNATTTLSIAIAAAFDIALRRHRSMK